MNLVGICDTSRGVKEKERENCERRNEFDYGNDRDCIIQLFSLAFSIMYIIDVYDYSRYVLETITSKNIEWVERKDRFYRFDG